MERKQDWEGKVYDYDFRDIRIAGAIITIATEITADEAWEILEGAAARQSPYFTFDSTTPL